MSVRSLLRVFLAVLWLWPATAFAQVEQWQSHMDAGVRAYHKGNYQEAEKQWVAAVKEAEEFGPQDLRLATSLNRLGEVYLHQRSYAKAEPLLKQALAIRKKALGPEHPHVATSFNNLAEAYRHQARYAEAEPLHKRALAIREKALGPKHPDVAMSLNNLALLYKAQGRYAEAEPLYQQALAILEKALGPDHPHVATSLENYAALLRKTGRSDEVAKMEARAHAIRAKHAEGADGPRLISINDTTQRIEFDGFSILPPRGKGWFMVELPPQVVPGLNAKAYFVKSLTEGVAPPSSLHRITAVVRTLSLNGVKFENRTELLKSIAKGFSGNSFLDKCLGWECARYESTREGLSRPKFPGFVFVISKQGFVVLHPDSRFLINLEYRQYYVRGQQPLSQKALEIEVEPFQKSLELTPIK